MSTTLRSSTLLLRNTDLSLTSTHTLDPLAYMCCWKCLYSTPKLKLVPLTLTRVWRNELYTLLSYGQLGLDCPKVLGSLSLGKSHHSCSILALVLKLARSRSLLPLPRTRRKLILPLATNTRIPSVPSILDFSLYGPDRPNHGVHVP